jgi:hypothetical protein
MDEVPFDKTSAVITNSLLLLFFIDKLARERCRIVTVQICHVQGEMMQVVSAFMHGRKSRGALSRLY